MAPFESEIVVTKKEMVHPLISSQAKRSKMCPSDLLQLRYQYSQKGFLYSILFSDDSHFHELVDNLKSALSHVLVYFYPLAGRLALSKDKVVYIDCNGQGVEFVEASAPSFSVEDALQDEVPSMVRDMFPLKGASNLHDKNLPLLGIQVTRLNDGVMIGLSINHAISDGTSSTHFINSWAELCRGSHTISAMPIHDKSFDIEGAAPIQFPNLPTTSYCEKDFTPPNISEKYFKFSKEMLSKMKGAAKQKGCEVSSLQCLFAHVWQCVTRARACKEEEVTEFKTWVNCRPRLRPALADEYFGNAIQSVNVKLSAEELLESHFSEVAKVLTEAMRGHRDAEIRSGLERYRKEPGFVSCDVKGSDNIVAAGGSPWFPMYDDDFGFGRPAGLRSGWATKFSGKIFVYPTKQVDGSIDLEVCLEPEEMVSLESDPLFLNPVSHNLTPLSSG